MWNQLPAHGDAEHLLETAVHNYFTYRANLNRLEFRHLLKQGCTSLIIGLAFLAACTLTSQLLRRQAGTLPIVLREGLIIAGWVAMWRPMEIFLYEWWPLLRTGQLYEKLSRMRVEVEKRIDSDNAMAVGLTNAEARKRLAELGENRIGSQRRAGAFTFFIAQFKSPIILILIGAAVVSLFLQDRTDAALILAMWRKQ